MNAKSFPNPLFTFNTSDNPFAYIRFDCHVYAFADLLKATSASDGSMLSAEGHKLLYMLSSLFIHECNYDDWSVSNLLRLLDCAQTSEYPFGSVLYYIFERNPSLFADYTDLINQCGGEDSAFFKQMIDDCKTYLSNNEWSSFVAQIQQKNTPMQAEWTASDGTVCDIWFIPAEVKRPRSMYSCHNQTYKSTASSHTLLLISLPEFLFSLDNTQVINEYLQSCIDKEAIESLTLKSYILSHQDEISAVAEKQYLAITNPEPPAASPEES